MDVDDIDGYTIPEGVDGTQFPVYSKAEERSLVRDSTASFSGASLHYSLLATLTATHQIGSHHFSGAYLPSMRTYQRRVARKVPLAASKKKPC